MIRSNKKSQVKKVEIRESELKKNEPSLEESKFSDIKKGLKKRKKLLETVEALDDLKEGRTFRHVFFKEKSIRDEKEILEAFLKENIKKKDEIFQEELDPRKRKKLKEELEKLESHLFVIDHLSDNRGMLEAFGSYITQMRKNSGFAQTIEQAIGISGSASGIANAATDSPSSGADLYSMLSGFVLATYKVANFSELINKKLGGLIGDKFKDGIEKIDNKYNKKCLYRSTILKALSVVGPAIVGSIAMDQYLNPYDVDSTTGSKAEDVVAAVLPGIIGVVDGMMVRANNERFGQEISPEDLRRLEDIISAGVEELRDRFLKICEDCDIKNGDKLIKEVDIEQVFLKEFEKRYILLNDLYQKAKKRKLLANNDIMNEQIIYPKEARESLLNRRGIEVEGRKEIDRQDKKEGENGKVIKNLSSARGNGQNFKS